jgi:hypothetical protein
MELERTLEVIQRVVDTAKEEAARQLRAAQEAMARKAKKTANKREEETKVRAAQAMRAQAKKLLYEANKLEKKSRREQAKAKVRDSDLTSLSSAAVTTPGSAWHSTTAPLMASAAPAFPSPAVSTPGPPALTFPTPHHCAPVAPVAPAPAATSLPTFSDSPSIAVVRTMSELSASYVAKALGKPDVPISPAIVQATQQIVGKTTLTAMVAMATMAYWQELGRVPTTEELSTMLGVDARPPPLGFRGDSPLRNYHTAVLGYPDGLVEK